MRHHISDRWNDLSPHKQGLIRYFVPLIGLGLVMAIDWWWLQRQGKASNKEALDLLKSVGWTCLLGAIVLIVGVRRWPFSSLGLLALLLGLAGLFIRVMGGIGPQPVSERERDLTQAALDIGSRLLVIGIAIWAIGRALGHGSSKLMNEDEWNHEQERRSEQDRRSGWGKQA